MRCENCGSGLSLSGACPVCVDVASASVGAVADDFANARAPLPAGPYFITLGPSEILNATIRMWRRDWGRLAVLGAIPVVATLPLVGAGGYAAVAYSDHVNDLTTAQVIAMVGVGIVATIAMGLAFLASNAAILALVDDAERSGTSSMGIGAAPANGLAKSGRLFAAAVVTSGALVVGAGAVIAPIAYAAIEDAPVVALGAVPGLALFIASLFLCLRLAPLWVIAVVEDISLTATFTRAWELTRGNVGTVFVSGLLYGVCMMGLSMATAVVGVIPIVGILVQLAVNVILSSVGPTWQLAMYGALVNHEQSQKESQKEAQRQAQK